MNLKCRKKLKSSQNIKKKLQDKHGLLWSPFSHLNIQSTRRQLGQWRGSPQLYRLTTRTSKYNTLPLRMICNLAIFSEHCYLSKADTEVNIQILNITELVSCLLPANNQPLQK